MSNKIKTSKKGFKLEIKKSKKWEIFFLIPINQKYNKITQK